MNSLSYVFFGATNYSKELLFFLLENNFVPRAIFSIPQEFNISYSQEKVINSNYANLKEIANRYNITYYEIDSVDGKKTKDYESVMKELELDLIMVLGWYYMVPKSTRNLSKYGAWGIHASLLPNYAGGAPLNWAIINGEETTGVTLFRMEDGVDDGDIISQKTFTIDFEDTIKEVYEKATIASKEILKVLLNDIKSIIFTPQNKSNIKVYPQRTANDGEINWSLSNKNIYNFIRAQTTPYPCAFSKIDNKIIKIINSKITELNNFNYKNGEIVNIGNKIFVATGDKLLEIGLIVDGNKTQKFEDYVNANSIIGKIFISNNFQI